MFEFAEVTKDMTASEILNYYRNLYYAEPQVTERGIVANAVNDFFADVVPKSEYDAVVSAVDNSTQEFLKLHDDYQEAKREVEMLQGALKAEERHNELTMEMAKKALANAKAEVAREIFEEIESKIIAEIDRNNGVLVEFEDADELYHRIKGEVYALCEIQDFSAELKKKYIGGNDNG